MRCLMKKLLITMFALSILMLLTISCDNSDCVVQEVVIGNMPEAVVNNYFEHNLSYTRTCTPELENWYLIGSLPPGLQFSSDGRISGRPTKEGDYDVTVEIECFFTEEYDEWDNPVYTDRSAVAATFTISVVDSVRR